MAQNATIYIADIQLSDMDRGHYQNYSMTIARHPSETDLRMMVRLLAYALNASDTLLFSKGISTENEPDIWQKNLSDEILLWIDLGQPDEKRIRKACGRSQQVIIYTYQQRSASAWWQQIKNSLQRFDNLYIYSLEVEGHEIEQFVDRQIQLQCTIQDGECWLTDGNTSTTIELKQWK